MNGPMTRREVTVSIEESLLHRVKVAAARKGLDENEVFEQALQAYLGWTVTGPAGTRGALTEEGAMELAVDEVHAFRSEQARYLR